MTMVFLLTGIKILRQIQGKVGIMARILAIALMPVLFFLSR